MVNLFIVAVVTVVTGWWLVMVDGGSVEFKKSSQFDMCTVHVQLL